MSKFVVPPTAAQPSVLASPAVLNGYPVPYLCYTLEQKIKTNHVQIDAETARTSIYKMFKYMNTDGITNVPNRTLRKSIYRHHCSVLANNVKQPEAGPDVLAYGASLQKLDPEAKQAVLGL